MISVELQNKLNKFNETYHVRFDIEGMESDVLKFAKTDDDFMFESVDDEVAYKENYYDVMKRLLRSSLNARTKISAEGKYSLDDFNVVRFLHDYEDLMAQKNAESKEPRDRAPFENTKFNDLLDRAKGITQPYNQSVYGIWADKIADAKDKFSFRDLRAVTDRAINAIEASLDGGNDTYKRSDLVNVVYAKAAMEKVRESRTGWWKFWNLLENYREYRYLEDLSKKVTEYRESLYPVNEILENAPQEILKNAYENPTASKDGVEQAAGQRRQLTNVEEKMKEVIKEPATKDSLTEEILKSLPEGGFPDALKENFLKTQILPQMMDKMQECNRDFDRVIENRLMTPETQMLYVVEKMYDKVFPMSVTLGYTDEKDQILAAQVITDAVLKKLSPVALDPEKLGQFADGYVVNNANAYSNITGFRADDPAMTEARQAFNAMKVDKVEVPEAADVSNAPMVQPIQNSAPVARPPYTGK